VKIGDKLICPGWELIFMTPVLLRSIDQKIWCFLEAASFLFLLAFLFVRSSLDWTTSYRLHLGPLAINPPAILSVTLILLFLRKGLWGRLRLCDRGLVRAYGIFLAVNALGLLHTLLRRDALRAASASVGLHNLFLLILFFLIYVECTYRVRGLSRFKSLESALKWSVAIPAAVAAWQVLRQTGYVNLGDYLIRANGTFSHPNTFGFYLVLFITLWLFELQQGGRIQWARVAIVLVLLTLLIFTYSRAAWGLATISFLFFLKGMSKKTLPAILAVLLLFAILSPFVWKRVEPMLVPPQKGEIAGLGGGTNSFWWRVSNLYHLSRMAREHPLWGHGLGTVTFLNPRPGSPAHSDLMGVSFELGLGGLAAYLYMLYRLGKVCHQKWKSSAQAESRGMAMAAYPVYWGMVLASVFGVDMLIQGPYLSYLWALVALAAASIPGNLGDGCVAADPFKLRREE
jgi:O-antigen ligase